MKKVLKSAVLSGLLVLALATSAFAVTAKDIGVVDTQKVIESSSLSDLYKSANDEMKALEDNIKKEMLDKSKKLEDAKKTNLSADKLKEMEDQFKKDLETKRNEGQVLYQKKQAELEETQKKVKSDIDEAIKKVADEKKLGVVFDKQVVLFGGVDVTEDVMKKIKK